jgi:hypothetical protein
MDVMDPFMMVSKSQNNVLSKFLAFTCKKPQSDLFIVWADGIEIPDLHKGFT